MKRCPTCDSLRDNRENFCSQCGTTLVFHELKCNLCGLSCAVGCDGSPAMGNSGLLEETVSGGYKSTPGNGHGAFDDCMSYTFSLCEFCLDWLFEQCQIPPRLASYMGGDPEPQDPEVWRSASDRVAQDDWRKMKQEFTDERDKRSRSRSGWRH